MCKGLLGVFPADSSSITGFPPGISTGVNAGNAAAQQAGQDAINAYTISDGLTPTAAIAGDLGGQVLGPGVYQSTNGVSITGSLVLDGEGKPNAVFVFQVGGALTTAVGSSVILTNGAQACNVFWCVQVPRTLFPLGLL